ncbi:hypothetical protein BH23GEM11_BH23GEM11_01530 [soil metagenome]
MDNTPESTHGTPATHGRTDTAPLAHLNEMDDYKIADGEPDIRGWDVKATDGQRIGEVEDLLFDTELMKVRYIEMKVEGKFTSGDDHRWALVPIGSSRLDEDHDNVLVSIASTELPGMPPYTRGAITRDYETVLLQRYGRGGPEGSAANADTDFYGTDHFDENQTFAGRRNRASRPTKGKDSYLTRSG